MTEPLSVCVTVGMRVVGGSLILLAGAFPLLSLLKPISRERAQEEHPLISRGIAKKSTASFQQLQPNLLTFQGIYYLARTPNIDRLAREWPHTSVRTSGEAVGLPEGQMGNSEVGHQNIGAGKRVLQDYTRVSESIRDGSFFHARAGRIRKTGPQLEAGAACVLLAQATETEAPAPSVKQPEIAQPQSSVELAGRHS